MKAPAVLAICLLSIFTGCMSVSREEMRQLTLRYYEVRPGMSKGEVLAKLGPPKKITNEGLFSWEAGDWIKGDWATLDLTFNEKGAAQGISRRTSAAIRPPTATRSVYSDQIDGYWDRDGRRASLP